MKRSALLLSFMLIFTCLTLWGQQDFPTSIITVPSCHTDILHQESMMDEKYQEQYQLMEKAAYDVASENGGQEFFSDYLLPVVVHIIHDGGAENISDAQVLQGIQDLNDAFANTGYYDQGTGVNTQIQFCLAKRAPDGTATTGINRVQSTLTEMTTADDLAVKDLIRWDPYHYINIWLVREICANGNCGVAGYAYFPANHGTPKDGIMMEARWFGDTQGSSGVQIHEMGHYLGLYHTFQDGCANDDCLADGDRVCDTPPDQSTAVVPCGGTANSCSTDANSGFATDENDMYWNYMDYGDFNCYSAFTQGQADRMAFFIDFKRYSLLDSEACDDPCPVSTEMSIDPVPGSIDLGTTVTFTLTAPALTDFQWFVGGVLAGTGDSFTYTFNEEGLFEIEVEGGNGSAFCQAFDEIFISVSCPVEASFTTSGLNVFIDESVTFTSTSIGATSVEWYLDGSLASTANSFSEIFPDEGFFAIQLIASNGICHDTTDVSYVIVQNPCDGGGAKELGMPIGLRPVEIRKLSDGGLVLISQSGTSDPTIVRLDANQEVVWAKKTGMTNLKAEDVVEDEQDGSLLFCGYLADPAGSKGFIFKLDADGNYLWGQQVTTTLTFFENMLVKPDGSVLVNGGGGDFGRMVNLQTDGTILWAKSYTGFRGDDISLNSDGEIFITGFNVVGAPTQKSVLVKFDENGSPLWGKGYNSSISNNVVGYWRPAAPNDQGGVVVPMVVTDADYNKLDILLSVDSDGDFLWAKKYDYSFNTAPATQVIPIPTLKRTPDGGYIFYSNKSTDLNASLTKVSETGEFLWSKNLTQAINFNSFNPRIEFLENGNMVVPHTGRLFVTDANGNLGTCPVTPINVVDEDILFTEAPVLAQEAGALAFEPVVSTTSDVPFFPNVSCQSQVANLPDAELSAIQAAFCNGVYEMSWEVCNLGTETIPSGTAFTFYDENPTVTSAAVLSTQTVPADLLPGACDTLFFSTPTLTGIAIYAVFNDAGGLTTPFDIVIDLAGAASVLECNFVNNWDSLSLIGLPTSTPQPFLGNDTTLCPGESIVLDPGVFENYAWQNGSTVSTLTASTPGTYQVTVTDACGETSADTIEIQGFTAPVLDLGPDVQVCENAAVPLDAGSGFVDYLWSDGSTEQTYTPWLPGEHFVQATDSCGGVHFDTINITYLPNTIIDLPDTIMTCSGQVESISLPGYDGYQWFPASAVDCATCPVVNITSTEDEVISVLVETLAGCYSSDSVAIVIMDTLQTAETISICAGDTIEIFGQDVSVAGDYSELFSSFNGCDSVHTVTLELRDTAMTFGQAFFCENDSVLVFGQWVDTPGNYEEIYTGANGCDSTHTITVTEAMTVETQEVMQICTGDSVLIFGNWEKTAGIYSGVFSASTGCDSIHQVELFVENSITTSEAISICQGDSALVFGQWVFTPGIFDETFISSFGCDSVHEISLTVLDTFLSENNIQICEGDSMLIFGNWEKTTGEYRMEYATLNGCDSTEVVYLSVLPSVSTNEFAQLCPGDSILINGQWINMDTVLMENLVNAIGCDSLHTTEIVLSPDIVVQVGSVVSVPLGSTIQLEATVLSGQPDLQYQWTPGAGLSCTDCPAPFASPDETTTYFLTVTDENGCSSIYQITVEVTPQESVYLPTAFSPNEDQVNDILYPKGAAGIATVRRLQVFDRWGEMVFENEQFELNDPAQGWDGMFRGQNAMAGVYVTVLELEWSDGRIEKIHGELVLMR